jgi:hypothetical protein
MKLRTALCQLALATALLGAPAVASAQVAVGISVNLVPPAIPVYVQPPCPAPNLMWTPGYWAWNGTGYYWVPGAWVPAPAPGLLWTPGYWGFVNGAYLWNAGYWGPHVGFYGGVNYGFGYGGIGFVGGEWRGGVFAYNTAVLRVNVGVVHTTFVDRAVLAHEPPFVAGRPSFNGGPNGIRAEPTAQERSFAAERHVAATPMQMNHEHLAAQDRGNFAAANHGIPAHAAMARPATSMADFNRARPAGARPAPGPRPAAAHEAARPGPRPEAARPAPRPAQARPEGHPQERQGRPEDEHKQQ